MIPFLKFLELIKVVNKLLKYAKINILMVSSILRFTSQVEHTKKRNSSGTVKQNTDHQNCLTVCFYILL